MRLKHSRNSIQNFAFMAFLFFGRLIWTCSTHGTGEDTSSVSKSAYIVLVCAGIFLLLPGACALCRLGAEPRGLRGLHRSHQGSHHNIHAVSLGQPRTFVCGKPLTSNSLCRSPIKLRGPRLHHSFGTGDLVEHQNQHSSTHREKSRTNYFTENYTQN